ncbi:hypothetical protein Cni_G16807 [Canna indica]|uniref:Large ribosomal subunit protein mL53 n=1 Tax=Canna indica TaxID=4628 RepID=A0AAQ3QH58_9LILI|nr:hypothetical protein Cni_G16807 [Canna indica]
MLKFLSKVRVEFNALDPRKAACVEILALCNARKAKESNPACQVELQRRTDDSPPRIVVTYVNGVEEVIDATNTPAQAIRQQILDRGQLLETEQMFRDAGVPWPVLIPDEEIHQSFPGTKPKKAEEKNQKVTRKFSCAPALPQSSQNMHGTVLVFTFLHDLRQHQSWICGFPLAHYVATPPMLWNSFSASYEVFGRQ